MNRLDQLHAIVAKYAREPARPRRRYLVLTMHPDSGGFLTIHEPSGALCSDLGAFDNIDELERILARETRPEPTRSTTSTASTASTPAPAANTDFPAGSFLVSGEFYHEFRCAEEPVIVGALDLLGCRIGFDLTVADARELSAALGAAIAEAAEAMAEGAPDKETTSQ